MINVDESSEIKHRIDDTLKVKTEELYNKFNNDIQTIQNWKIEYTDYYHTCINKNIINIFKHLQFSNQLYRS